MRHDPVTVTKDIGTSESVALMKRKGVNSLLVVDDEGRLEGVVTVDKIRKQGKAGRNISELIDKDIRTIPTNTNAREAFDILIEDKLDYLAVVDDKNKVKGLVTKTSIVKALAEVVWKDNGHE
jgi:osmoprotectant transport system ATP-binding protein